MLLKWNTAFRNALEMKKKCSWNVALSKEMLLKWNTALRNGLEMKHCLKKCSWNEALPLEMLLKWRRNALEM